MKTIIKSILPARITLKLKEIKSVRSELKDINRSLNILMNERKINKNASQREILKQSEFKIYSQSGIDGLLNYIFNKIGTINRTFVEIGIENGRECNTANLIMHNDWNGLMIEGNKKCVKEALIYYNLFLNKIKIVNEFITAENINSIIKSSGISGDIDLLSIDIDGNDYWIWKAVGIINPRVVVIEYNTFIGSETSTVIEYEQDFIRETTGDMRMYYGASLKAFKELGMKKGYKLIGCDSFGCNAIFIRKDIFSFEEQTSRESYYLNTNMIDNPIGIDKIKQLGFTII